jgi:hypothetical protein
MHITLEIFPILPNDRANLPTLIKPFGSFLVHNRLQFTEDYRIFSQIIDVSKHTREDGPWHSPVVTPIRLPENTSLFMYHDEGLIEETRNDLDGSPICYLPASEFGKIDFPEDTKQPNLAIKAFLAALPPESMIILYWSS